QPRELEEQRHRQQEREIEPRRGVGQVEIKEDGTGLGHGCSPSAKKACCSPDGPNVKAPRLFSSTWQATLPGLVVAPNGLGRSGEPSRTYQNPPGRSFPQRGPGGRTTYCRPTGRSRLPSSQTRSLECLALYESGGRFHLPRRVVPHGGGGHGLSLRWAWP